MGYQFPANDLELYMAFNGLSRDEAKIKTLNEDGEIPGCIKMDEMLEIQDGYHFGIDFQPENGKIYVLVVLPPEMPATSKRSIEELGEIVEESVKKVLTVQGEKMSVHSMSDMNSEKKHRILQKLSLAVKVLTLNEPRDTSIPCYQWKEGYSEDHDEQRAQYMAYLKTHLKTLLDNDCFSLVDIASKKSVLNTADPRLPFRLNGTADILLVNSNDTDLIPMAGLCFVIELQKKVEKKHIYKAIAQLVCTSIKAPLGCYPMSLLTDLNDTWHFCYFSEKNVLNQVIFKYPKNAIDFIKATIVDQPERDIFPLLYFPMPFKKMKVDDFLPRPVDQYAAELMENYELMADELEPEFLMARRMEYAQHLVQSIPMYAHMYV
ncbi:Crinkler (CRN) family protein [Thraustotheca clavata]|uniref:Crinkler (CRN) family protein n=1 Tax=Thraustotheca clavata TaxID=74557 RepID=A0A1V9Y6S4_9STRA|nr:Crinkler (CRN) family protein [Thraustotheca clavata]